MSNFNFNILILSLIWAKSIFALLNTLDANGVQPECIERWGWIEGGVESFMRVRTDYTAWVDCIQSKNESKGKTDFLRDTCSFVHNQYYSNMLLYSHHLTKPSINDPKLKKLTVHPVRTTTGDKTSAFVAPLGFGEAPYMFIRLEKPLEALYISLGKTPDIDGRYQFVTFQFDEPTVKALGFEKIFVKKTSFIRKKGVVIWPAEKDGPALQSSHLGISVSKDCVRVVYTMIHMGMKTKNDYKDCFEILDQRGIYNGPENYNEDTGLNCYASSKSKYGCMQGESYDLVEMLNCVGNANVQYRPSESPDKLGQIFSQVLELGVSAVPYVGPLLSAAVYVLRNEAEFKKLLKGASGVKDIKKVKEGKKQIVKTIKQGLREMFKGVKLRG